MAFSREAELEKMKGFAGYAIDRISYDEKYKDVFLYLLGRTIIADGLDDAIAISARNETGWRIVTKEGEVISPAGALTGGAYRNKTANLLERRNEIDTLKAEISALGEKERGLREAAEGYARSSEELLARIRENDADHRNAEAAFIRAQEERRSAEYLLSELEKRLDRARAEIEGIAKDRETSAGMISGLRESIDGLGERIEAVSLDIENEISGLAPAKELSDSAQATATELRLKAAEAGRDKENADTGLRTMKADLDEMRERLRGLKAERAEIEGVAPALTDEEAAAELTNLTEAKGTLDAELAAGLSERAGVRSQIEDKEITFGRSLERIEAQISSRIQLPPL
jgi:chromosome segregation protein